MTTLNFHDNCPMAKTVTISNTSSVPLTWQMSGNLSNIAVTPLGSTLPAGGAVDVSVTPKVNGALFDVSIDADIAPSQLLTISIVVSGGYFTGSLADVYFGNVPIGMSSTQLITAPSFPGVILASANAAFKLLAAVPYSPPGSWVLTFTPTSPGDQQSTLTVGSMVGVVCPPNTFIAHGVGVAP